MRLPYSVVSCDSESKEHPSSNLHDPSTPHPWISAPFPLYPQELTIAVRPPTDLDPRKLGIMPTSGSRKTWFRRPLSFRTALPLLASLSCIKERLLFVMKHETFLDRDALPSLN